MNRIVITFTDALTILVALVKDFGPEHTATDPTGQSGGGTDGGCTYFSRNKTNRFGNPVPDVDPFNLVPVCIVGQVFSRLGILRALLREGEAIQYGTCSAGEALWDNAVTMGVEFTDEAKNLLRNAQRIQDGGNNWRDAVTSAVKEQQEVALATFQREDARFKANALLFGLPEVPKPETNEDEVARTSEVVRDFMREGRRINAIKEVRAVTLCGLKEAKEAVERAYPLHQDYSNI